MNVFPNSGFTIHYKRRENGGNIGKTEATNLGSEGTNGAEATLSSET